jgi:hypothetical protein
MWAAYAIGYAILIWWLIAPFIACAIGLSRGHGFAGLILGMVPLFGPWLAARLIPKPPA